MLVASKKNSTKRPPYEEQVRSFRQFWNGVMPTIAQYEAEFAERIAMLCTTLKQEHPDWSGSRIIKYLQDEFSDLQNFSRRSMYDKLPDFVKRHYTYQQQERQPESEVKASVIVEQSPALEELKSAVATRDKQISKMAREMEELQERASQAEQLAAKAQEAVDNVKEEAQRRIEQIKEEMPQAVEEMNQLTEITVRVPRYKPDQELSLFREVMAICAMQPLPNQFYIDAVATMKRVKGRPNLDIVAVSAHL